MDNPTPQKKAKMMTKREKAKQDFWNQSKEQRKKFKNSEAGKILQKASYRLELFFKAKVYNLEFVFGRTSLPDNISNQAVVEAIQKYKPTEQWLIAQSRAYLQVSSTGPHIQAMVTWNGGTRDFKDEFMRLLTIRNSKFFHDNVSMIEKQRGKPVTKTEMLTLPYRMENTPRTTLPLMQLWEAMPRLDKDTILFSGKSGRVEKYDLGLYKAVYEVLEADRDEIQHKMPSWITPIPTATSMDFCDASVFSLHFMTIEVSHPKSFFESTYANRGKTYVSTPDNERRLKLAQEVEKKYPLEYPFNDTNIMMRLHCPKGLPALSMDTIWQKVGPDGHLHNLNIRIPGGWDYRQNREGLKQWHDPEKEVVLPPYLRYTLLSLTFMRIPMNDRGADYCLVPTYPNSSYQPSDIEAEWGSGNRLLMADIKVELGFWPRIRGQ